MIPSDGSVSSDCSVISVSSDYSVFSVSSDYSVFSDISDQGRSLVVSLLPGNPPWQSDSALS